MASLETAAPMAQAAARLRVGHLLNTVRLEPPAMPSAAILIVRHLSDPLPGRLAKQDALMASPEWVRAGQAALARCFDAAACPAAGPVPANANAVRFNDRSELLACLARDFLLGDLQGHWWWQTWLRARGRSMLDAVINAWLQDARCIPAAIAALQRGPLAARFCGRLTARDARSLFVAMAHAYDLPALARETPSVGVARLVARGPHRPADTPVELQLDDDRADHSPAAAPSVVMPPWDWIVDAVSVPATLAVEQRSLLGVALAIWRAPLAVRTPSFRDAFHMWRQSVENGRPAAPPVLSERPPAIEQPRSPLPLPPEVTTTELSVDGPRLSPVAEADEVEMPAQRAREAPPEPLAPSNPQGDAATLDRAATDVPDAAEPDITADYIGEPGSILPGVANLTPTRTVNHAAEQLLHIKGSPVPPSLQPQVTTVTPAVAQATTSPRSQLVAFVHTQLGGILFLINALERDAAWQRLADAAVAGQPIGGWSWLAIIARRVLGDRADLAEDPIWTALASVDDERATETEPAVARFDRLATATAPIVDAFVEDLEQRLHRVLPLGLHAIDDSRALPAARVLFRRGRLAVTATHVDLYMTMNQADIAVRLAGLDANPGWVPALGRVITFYYE